MGDPVSTGEALNQVHRPKFPIALFGLAVVLTVLGIAMQYLVYTHLTPDTAILSDTYLQRTILYNAIGLGLLLLCIFGNYMYLAKGAWILLAIFFTWSATAMVLRLLRSAVHPLLLSGTGLSAGICPCCYTGYGIRGKKPFGSCTD